MSKLVSDMEDLPNLWKIEARFLAKKKAGTVAFADLTAVADNLHDTAAYLQNYLSLVSLYAIAASSRDWYWPQKMNTTAKKWTNGIAYKDRY